MFSGSWLELRSLVCIYPGYIKDTPRQLVHPLCAKHFGCSTESQRGCPLSVLGYLGVRCTGRGPDVEAQVASRLSIFRGAPPLISESLFYFLWSPFSSSGHPLFRILDVTFQPGPAGMI